MVSGADLFFALFNNLAIFIALTAVYGNLLGYLEKKNESKRQLFIGLLFGFFAIGCMYAKIPVYKGVIVDQRNAIVALSGLFGGIYSAIISAALAGSYRLYLGGGGALAGAVGVCLAAVAGIFLKTMFKRLDTFIKGVAGALLATIIILPGFLFVDDIHTGFALMKSMALPYGAAIFLGIALVSFLLNRQTELFNFEKAFRRSEEKYREFVEGTSDLITSVNAKGEFLYVNKMSEKIFGLPPDEIIDMSAFDFVHPDDRERVEEKFSQCVEKQVSSTVFENRQVNRQNGDVYTMLWTVNFHYDNDGRLNGASGIAHDITERKEAEERLHIFNELINKSNDAIFVIDPETANILDVNMTACEQLGYTKNELLEMKVSDIFSNMSGDGKWREHIRELRKKSFLLVEGEHEKEGGIKISMEISVTLSQYVDREYIIAVARDLTRRKALEAKLNQAHKMEAVGRLAGGIAHDLNNLLTPVIGYGEMLMIDPQIKEKAKKQIGAIVKAGKGARDLVRQLLAFSRKQVLEYTSVDINQVLDGFEDLIRRTIREDIEITVVKSSRLEPVMADIGQIEQVIMNLLVNAADAMPEGGKITIETSLTEIDEQHEAIRPGVMAGMYVMLSVSDTGYGMDETTQAQIFEPFFSTKGELGTGLGLATVYGIVKQHNGNIWVYSEPGKGTIFKIYLPVTETRGDSRMHSADSSIPGGTETILLVEDNKEVRNTVLAVLEQLGYTVLVAQNGIDAMNKMSPHGNTVQLLLTDVVMPGMNGKELYQNLSVSHPGLKVLYMSGYTDNIVVHHGVLDAGAHLLNKPFTTRSIAVKIRDVIDK